MKEKLEWLLFAASMYLAEAYGVLETILHFFKIPHWH